MSEEAFRERLWLSSVPLVRLDDQGLPNGFASGALVDYCGTRLLLTVEHATGDQRRWGVQVRFDSLRGQTLIQPLWAMNFLMQGSIFGGKPKTVDLSYVEVPSELTVYRQEIEWQGHTVKSETEVEVHHPSLTNLPVAGTEYGFCGMVKSSPEEHAGQVLLFCEPRIYSGLSYLRTEDGYHYFKLPFPHPGHEEFRGCSGAPVLSKSGALIGLLCGGCTKTNEVWAISTAAYKTPIDILVGNIN